MFDRFMTWLLRKTEPQLFTSRERRQIFDSEEDARQEAMRLTFTRGRVIVGKQRSDGRWELTDRTDWRQDRKERIG